MVFERWQAEFLLDADTSRVKPPAPVFIPRAAKFPQSVPNPPAPSAKIST
jgi:hypothetical protein